MKQPRHHLYESSQHTEQRAVHERTVAAVALTALALGGAVVVGKQFSEIPAVASGIPQDIPAPISTKTSTIEAGSNIIQTAIDTAATQLENPEDITTYSQEITSSIIHGPAAHTIPQPGDTVTVSVYPENAINATKESGDNDQYDFAVFYQSERS